MNKKISRLLEPGLQFYFFVMACFAVAAAFYDIRVAAAEGCIIVAIYIYFHRSSVSRRKSILRYIESVTYNVDSATKDTMLNSPLPMVIFRPETQEIIWGNESFLSIAGQSDHIFDMKIGEVVPRFTPRWLLESKRECPEPVELNGRRFRVYGNLTHTEDSAARGLLATTYWIDVTESDEAIRKYSATRPVVAIIIMDSYEELMKNNTDAQKSQLLSSIDSKVGEWAASAHGLLRKYDRDRYLFVFEDQFYDRFVEDKFSLLDSVHEFSGSDGSPVTLSIGIGKDDDTFEALFHSASLSIDMALSRGGDQAVVRNQLNFEFYGGRSKETEKRTKVKSRVMASALGEFISDADQIFIMGHRAADLDSFGAAVGLCCIARKLGKSANIVINPDISAAAPMIERVRSLDEYKNTLMDPTEALLKAHSGSLLIVVDTNRPDMTESPQLLDACNRVAVIDHHRRAATYITDAALNFHEPYASSASELVTELLQYLVEPSDIINVEAEALLAGIVLDTKNFTVRTGGRTFDAAAYLRRAGADTTEVRRLFQNDLDSTINRYDIIRRAKMVHGNVALAAVDLPVGRITAAQAADELLLLVGVGASFVLTPDDSGGVNISARSLGDINVQVILESLGGGGNAMSAGGRIPSATVAEVEPKLLKIIDSYFEE
ncbi:MAG: DHH family phosphoesterase [Oscillospiraceae bacterium]|nr:DHH family phosphoesterase [Oscillospiraceae bacterium]